MKKHAETGFSLIEVLVSLLVLSVGIIGAASMQLNALRSNQQSGFHSTALQLAIDTADQIRAATVNNDADAANAYLRLDFKSEESVISAHSLCYDVSSACNAVEITDAQIYEIQRRLKSSLPNGRIKVCRDAAPWSDSSNTYQWDCHDAGKSAPIVVKLSWRSPSDHTALPAGGKESPRLVILVQT
ncbi:type IV pilus assembly protein PilV [Paucimonas lemoignei]|uniref:Type IV pilus assembly protein PilV n=1 Tax=Paucimonas lemoignei TaxID=29443 RepID=A0A4R3HT98_PAULE|nr:type IV pilus modification protein PilV [Paucimonas lemoignei]TCS35703.1 type IV pilus assembly protein PilV [Paucimonas lemoignei]